MLARCRLNREQLADYSHKQVVAVPPELAAHETLAQRQRHSIVDDLLNDPLHMRLYSALKCALATWCNQHKVRRELNVLLRIGASIIGTLCVYFPADRPFTNQQIELSYALAQQVTLSLRLTQLVEEAKQAAILEERNRLAGEIHDTLAQAFTGISMQLGVAKWPMQQDSIAVDDILDRINDIAQSGLAEARRSIWTLYPVEQVYANLAQQLSRCVKQMTSGTPIQVDVQISGSPRPLSPLVGKNLLRIGQEAITNTLKHAQATSLNIHLTYTEQTLCLCIQDNGCGFPTNLGRNGFGLISMSDRADRISGYLMINSQPGQGTEISIQVPLP